MLKPVLSNDNPNKASWFEFLLDPKLLQNHLSKYDEADPSAGELIIQFLVNSNAPLQTREPSILQACIEGLHDALTRQIDERKDNEVEESKKSQSLKILALKTCAFMSWDLEFIESKLPLTMQYSLMTSLLHLILKDVGLSAEDEKYDFGTMPSPAIFALSLYHRWCVSIILKNSIPKRPQKTPAHLLQLPGQNDPTIVAPAVIESTISKIEEKLQYSVDILEDILLLQQDVIMPTLDSFGSITEETVSVTHNWNDGLLISHLEFSAQTAFDLACFYFFQQNYENASQKFDLVHRNLSQITPTKFCRVNEEILKGFCHACNHISGRISPSDDLIDQINQAAEEKSTDLLTLLGKDNEFRLMPIHLREKIENNLYHQCKQNPFFHFQVFTLNVVRLVIDGFPVYRNFATSMRYHNGNGFAFLSDVIRNTIAFCNKKQIILIKNFIRSLLMDADSPFLQQLNKQPYLKTLFSVEELTHINKYVMELKIEKPIPVNIIDPKGSKNVGDFSDLQKQLILTYELADIEKLLGSIHKLKGRISPLQLNQKWNIPQSLHNMLTAMHPSFYQDMSYIVLAKANELKNVKKYTESRALFRAVETELRDQNFQLSQLIKWEILLVNIMLFGNDQKCVDARAICQNVKSCISAVLDRGANIYPRPEIVENCAAFLINTQEWNFLQSLGISRSGFIEFAKLIAAVCQELKENKGNRMASQELWMIILPIFTSTQSQLKRMHSGSMREQHREAPHAILTKIGLIHFLDKINDATALSIMVSCFSKLFNLLKDDATYNLHVEHETLWTVCLQNANSISLPAVKENLEILLKHALNVQPNNTNWLKTVADIAYAHGYYAQAIKYYLKAAISVSDYFSNPVPRPVWNDEVYNRLIRCSTHLHCFTQAAVLCQFTTEIDYAAAFKWLSERPCSDSCDSYYEFIWDVTLLEYLVNLHAKRAETEKRQLALSSIGLLELNSNNNEEILRNAAQIRKTKFLIAISKQYL